MIKPHELIHGDTIGIVAPGRKVSSQDVVGAKGYFESLGLRVVLGANLFSNEHNYLSASDEHRLVDLQTMVDDNTIKAIVCARGGYGTTRILDRLVLDSLQLSPKWIVGFSDITSLHLKLFGLGVQSLHAIMPVLFAHPDSAISIESLKQNLFGTEYIIEAGTSRYNKTGDATGQVIGGNLSLLLDSLGTATEPNFNNKILIVEEIDEYLYKIDRMFMQLERAGALKNLNGLVVGHMTKIKDTTPGFGEGVEQIIVSKTRAHNYPVAFNFPIGHENPNLAWRHGSFMELTVRETGSSLQAGSSS